MPSHEPRSPVGSLKQFDARPLEISDLATIVWSARTSVVQVETLDSYGVAHEDAVYRAFKDRRAPTEEELAGYKFWFEKVKAAVDRNVDVARTHILPDRLNDYLEYEMEFGYRKWCIPMGEKVHTIKRTDYPDLCRSASRDFYTVDDQRVLLPIYTGENKFVGLEEVVGPEAIRSFVNLKNQLLRWSTPLTVEGPLPIGR